MEASSPRDSSVLSSPYSSPNLSALLKIKIISWSQETGLPVTVRVRVGDKSFNLHKIPLTSKSGYFKRHLSEWQEVDLPEDFPGGSQTFGMIALFIYGSSTFIDPFNVASLRCAAEFLEMNSEVYGSNNLCERTDLYLNQVVLQSWDDTLIVLQKCQALLPWSEDLLIVSRCIESLAFMACMEILDPERKRDNRTIVSFETLASQPWRSEVVKETLKNQDLWVKDLIALQFGFFKRIIGSLRRQGMKEKYLGPIIIFYANKWVLSKKTRQFWQCLCDENEDNDTNNSNSNSTSVMSDRVVETLQGILDLLPTGEKSSRVIPVGFYFALLARSLELGGTSEGRVKLQERIVPLLPLAHVDDFLLPMRVNGSFSSTVEMATMESIFSSYALCNMESEQSDLNLPTGNSIVAELWDMYLSRMANDPSMTCKRFLDLIETVPLSFRITHDHLFRAMSIYLKAHPNLSQEDKSSVCKHLNCHKLSQEACVEAVQNEFMPLRLIVQALFVQQLNTQQAFKQCSDSFRFAYSGELFSGSLTSTKNNNPNSNNSPLFVENDRGETIISPLDEVSSTSFRIHSLEKELMALKKTLELQTTDVEVQEKKTTSYGLGGRSFSKRRNAAIGQVTGCIGSVSFGSQRKYAGRLLKMFRRVALFGRPKPKRRSS